MLAIGPGARAAPGPSVQALPLYKSANFSAPLQFCIFLLSFNLSLLPLEDNREWKLNGYLSSIPSSKSVPPSGAAWTVVCI